MEILKSMKDTDYETLMNNIVNEIETKVKVTNTKLRNCKFRKSEI